MNHFSQKKKIWDDVWSRVADPRETGKGHQRNSEVFGRPSVHNWQTAYKQRRHRTVATLPRSGRPAKMTPKPQRRILNEVKKSPRLSAWIHHWNGWRTSLIMSRTSVSHWTGRMSMAELERQKRLLLVRCQLKHIVHIVYLYTRT